MNVTHVTCATAMPADRARAIKLWMLSVAWRRLKEAFRDASALRAKKGSVFDERQTYSTRSRSLRLRGGR